MMIAAKLYMAACGAACIGVALPFDGLYMAIIAK